MWLSQWQEDKDEAEMQRGVDQCDALVLIMTPGIFQKDRYWVTHTEVKYAGQGDIEREHYIVAEFAVADAPTFQEHRKGMPRGCHDAAEDQVIGDKREP